METKINIAAILKDKPQGTKLYDWLHNIDVELDTISTTDTETVVWCTNETNLNNCICCLKEALEELSKSDWVSVEDGLPPYDESVLVTNKETPKIVLKTSRTKCKGWNTDENGFLCAIAFNITHWKPIEKLED